MHGEDSVPVSTQPSAQGLVLLPSPLLCHAFNLPVNSMNKDTPDPFCLTNDYCLPNSIQSPAGRICCHRHSNESAATQYLVPYFLSWQVKRVTELEDTALKYG